HSPETKTPSAADAGRARHGARRRREVRPCPHLYGRPPGHYLRGDPGDPQSSAVPGHARLGACTCTTRVWCVHQCGAGRTYWLRAPAASAIAQRGSGVGFWSYADDEVASDCSRFTSTGTPRPIVGVSVAPRSIAPLAQLGRLLTISRKRAERFVSSCST